MFVVFVSVFEWWRNFLWRLGFSECH